MVLYKLSLVLDEGLIFGLLAVGIYIAFQWLRFPDLTPDGSFVLGACAYTKAALLGVPPVLCVIIAFVAGCFAGCCTAAVNRLAKIPSVVSGLLVSSALYSLSWMILGKPNQYLDSRLTLVGDVTGPVAAGHLLFWLFVITLIIVATVSVIGRSLWGLQLRALGENPLLERDMSASTTVCTFLSLSAANGLVGLAGCLFAQRSYSADVNMGIGVTITGLAGMILGLLMAQQRRRLSIITACIVLGAVLFKLMVFSALEVGIPAEAFRLVSATMLVVVFFLIKHSSVDFLKGLKWN